MYAGLGVRPISECAHGRDNPLERVLHEYRFQPLDVYALLPPAVSRAGASQPAWRCCGALSPIWPEPICAAWHERVARHPGIFFMPGSHSLR